jgi:hypothetical protein
MNMEKACLLAHHLDLKNPSSIAEVMLGCYRSVGLTPVRRRFSPMDQPGQPNRPASLLELATLLRSSLDSSRNALFNNNRWRPEGRGTQLRTPWRAPRPPSLRSILFLPCDFPSVHTFMCQSCSVLSDTITLGSPCSSSSCLLPSFSSTKTMRSCTTSTTSTTRRRRCLTGARRRPKGAQRLHHSHPI